MGNPKGVMPPEAKNLNPPKYDPISLDELSRSDGSDPSRPTLVAIKGVVFDVSGNPAYKPGGSYNVFAGKDASRALACSSLKAEDCRPDWGDLEEKEKGVLEEWFAFFSKRYNVVGMVAGATNC
ncbi:hypothetical protein PRK78_000983 [Emydomyces testavorans]|uniref:Cytochrome b5 heme-binding domain-containing protein n=1 Tax=Emydomyces testavorans TaxID=2070801 RepID=A0AAF0DDJ2_9EURO|nr:hypothetical protein PRK78_000983 [Emydomyces testavorans]